MPYDKDGSYWTDDGSGTADSIKAAPNPNAVADSYIKGANRFDLTPNASVENRIKPPGPFDLSHPGQRTATARELGLPSRREYRTKYTLDLVRNPQMVRRYMMERGMARGIAGYNESLAGPGRGQFQIDPTFDPGSDADYLAWVEQQADAQIDIQQRQGLLPQLYDDDFTLTDEAYGGNWATARRPDGGSPQYFKNRAGQRFELPGYDA